MILDVSKEKCPACEGTDLKLLPRHERMCSRPQGSVVFNCGGCHMEYAAFIPGQSNSTDED